MHDNLKPTYYPLNAPAARRTTLPRTAQWWATRIGLVLMGIALAAMLVEAAFRLLPGLHSITRARAVDMGTVRFTAGMGDIFLARPGVVAPPADPELVLSEHRLAWDADGFRVPARPSAHYDVLALGDSYTEGANAALPWPDVLARESGLPVRNMGFRGYGPDEELKVLQEFGPQAAARTVIVGYFEGNDLIDVITAQSSQGFVLPSIMRKTFMPFDPSLKAWKTDNPGPFQYPISVNIGGQATQFAFLDAYLSILNGEYNTYAQSENAISTGKIWQQMAATVPNSCLVIAYFPDTPHIYAPYVIPADREHVLSTLNTRTLSESGAQMGEEAQQQSYELLLSRLDNQRNAMRDLATQLHIPFIDLTPTFQQAAAQGQILYYTYDTHWNQAGHDLAGKTIADWLKQNPNACARP